MEASQVDVDSSRQLKRAGELVGITMLDSLVVGFDGEYTSLAEEGRL